MTVNSDATVMNPGKGEQGQQVEPLPSPRRILAQSWSRRCPFWLPSRPLRDTAMSWERSGVRAGGARLPAAGALGAAGRAQLRGCPGRAGGLRAAAHGKLSSLAARLLGFTASLLPSSGRDPPPRARPGDPLHREPESSCSPTPTKPCALRLPEGTGTSLYLQSLVGACCRSRPRACRGSEWCFPSRGPVRRSGCPAPSPCCEERGVPPSAPLPQPCRPTRPVEESAPAENSGGKGGRAPLACSSRLRRGLRQPLGVGGAGAGAGAHSPHSDAYPGDEQSHASGLCEDAQVPSDPSTGAGVGAHPSPLGQALRRAEGVGEPGWLTPFPVVLSRPLPGVGRWGVFVAVCVRGIRHRRAAGSDCSRGWIRVWRDGARSESSDNNRIRH